MRNLTVTIPDATYRAARIKAAELDTSISALVTEYLRSLSQDDENFRQLALKQEELISQITQFSASTRISRSEVHDREIR